MGTVIGLILCVIGFLFCYGCYILLRDRDLARIAAMKESEEEPEGESEEE